jgi:hypothetical protein
LKCFIKAPVPSTGDRRRLTLLQSIPFSGKRGQGGEVDERPPFAKEMRESETGFQGFPQGVYSIRVDPIEVAPPK